jgi:hypothetical protein
VEDRRPSTAVTIGEALMKFVGGSGFVSGFSSPTYECCGVPYAVIRTTTIIGFNAR